MRENKVPETCTTRGGKDGGDGVWWGIDRMGHGSLRVQSFVAGPDREGTQPTQEEGKRGSWVLHKEKYRRGVSHS